MVGDTLVTVQIWDTAGTEQYESVSFAFYRGADCCALVYDITNKESFEKLGHWRKGFIDNTGIDVDTFPFVVMGNKADLENERAVTKDQVDAWCNQNNSIPHYETSAKDNVGVDQAFMDVIKQAIQKQSEDGLNMPSSIGGGIGSNPDGGNIKLNARSQSNASAYERKKKCSC